MMNSPIVSADISVDTSTGITSTNRNVTSAKVYHRSSSPIIDHQPNVGDDLEDVGDDVDTPCQVAGDFVNCHDQSIASMPMPEPTCSQAEETSARKRRKQSNPVRYGQSTAVLPMELDNDPEIMDDGDDDDDESLVAAGRRVAEELQRPGSFGSSDDLLDADEDELDDEKPLGLDRRKMIENSITSVMNFHRTKYQYYCPHCNCPFSSDDDLRNHIEQEHVQKLLERQLFHHQQQLSIFNNNNNKPTSNGPSQLRAPTELLASLKSFDQQARKMRGGDSGTSGSSCSSGSNNNTPSQSPSADRKPFDLNQLPHPGSGDTNSAKDFASFLPFQLPNLPPLIPLSQANSDGSSKLCPTTTSPAGQQQIPLAMFPNPMAPFLFPVLSGQANNGGGSMPNGGPQVSASGVRIFNPEAYCELCNKEFCNKYFLKTHKANKHGIYSMETIVGPTPYPGGAFFPAGLPQSAPNANANAAQQQAAAAAAMQMQQLLQAGAQMQPTGSDPNQSAPNMPTPTKTGIVNLESYCEICQKEFCNKYFLKKHKQKIHGIIDPNQSHQQSSSASPGSSHSNEPQNKNSPSPSLSIIASSAPLSLTSAAPIMSVPNFQLSSAQPGDKQSTIMVSVPISCSPTSISQSKSQTKPSQGQGFACDACHQEFGNVMQLQTHQLTVHGQLLGQATSIIMSGANVINSQASDSEQSMAGQRSVSISSDQPISSIFTPDKLREMGVLNADAFCDICCKEFCNKYFLRTHKMNKHGIDGGSSTKSHNANDLKSNDIDNSEMSPKSNDDSFLEPGQRDPTTYGVAGDFFSAISSLASVNADLLCDICNRPFASNYLLKMHKFYSHNIPYIKEEDIRKSLAASPGASSEAASDNNINTVNLIQPKFDQQSQMQVNQQNQRPLSNGNDQNQASDNQQQQQSMMSPAEQASQDLQKLQSMIKELNNSSFLDRAMCNLCRQEFENKYFLRVHMMNDHGVIPTEDSSAVDQTSIIRNLFDPTRIAFPQIGSGPPGSGQSGDSEAFCELCQKEFCSKYFLRTHRQNIHGIFDPPTPTDSNPPTTFPTQTSPHQMVIFQQQQRNKPGEEQSTPMNLQVNQNKGKPQSVVKSPALQQQQQQQQQQSMMTPDGKPRNVTGRNYCNICNKELCNKYFMKTHMLKMHGINIDEHPAEAASTSTIGGVTCDICQKELCSKYFLKVHKQNTHGIYEEPPQPKEPKNHHGDSQSEKDSQAHGIDPTDTNNRYFSHYTEVCPLCERRFKSIKWLKTHMINDHSDIVSMRPTDLSMTGAPGPSPNAIDSFGRMCMMCGQSFADRVALHIHLVKDHRTSAEELGGLPVTGFPNAIKLVTTQAADLSTFGLDNGQSISQQHAVIQQMPLSLQMPRINGTTSPANSAITSINYNIQPNNQSANNSNNNPMISSGIAVPAISSAITNTSNTIIIPNTSNSLAKANFDGNSRPPRIDSISTLIRPAANSMPIIKRTGNGTRIYQCSYCNYTTRWLSNLYAHEKRHSRVNSHVPVNLDFDKKFVCRICHRAYRYNHSLQRHLHSHRLGLTSRDDKADGKSNHLTDQPPTEGGSAKVKRYRCSKCNKKFRTRDLCLAHIHMYHSDSKRIILTSGSGSSKVCRCAYCGFATRNYTILKIHINKNHANRPNDGPLNAPTDLASHLTDKDQSTPLNLRKAAESALSLVTNKLDRKSPSDSSDFSNDSLTSNPQDYSSGQQLQLAAAAAVSQQAQLPMTYAMPQSPPNEGSFIMQPFLITQPNLVEGPIQNDTFVPSLVYLPVAHKVLQPVRVAFHLTPA